MVTFLLTDIEGSSRHWEERPVAMRAALALHDDVVTSTVEANGGTVLTSHGEGDSFFAVFRVARDGVVAAGAIQRALETQRWPEGSPLRVRMAIHSGEAGPDYRGPTANRCARIRACAHGGQVVLSQAAAALAGPLPPGMSLLDLGQHRLRDMSRPERLQQLVVDGLGREFPPLRSLGAFSHNLPVQLTTFVGRDGEVGEVKRLLAHGRLVTLSGPGGCGKSRLALQVAAEVVESYPGGAWFVDLAPLADPGLVAHAVAEALGEREGADRDLLATLGDRLSERPTLLVLDNCEHLVAGCADLARALLSRCPELRLLLTSREVLNEPGEQAWEVPSLAVPADPGAMAITELARTEAIALFLDRGATARPGFTLNAGNAATVARVCRRLEGIPLAIELAAARLRILSADELLHLLSNRFRLLKGGPRSGLGRHRTLTAAIDWSYDLLERPERALFERLSIFSGWSLEAAQAVCAGETLGSDQVLDVLQRLVDKSLVLVLDEGDPTRYRMLETLREYSQERLRQGGGVEALRRRHLDHHLALAESLDVTLGGREESECLRRLAPDHQNLLLALGTAREHDPDALVRTAGALAWYWAATGRLREGRRWLEAALGDRVDRTWARAHALKGLAVVLLHQGDHRASRRHALDALDIFDEVGDRQSVARCHNNLGIVAYADRDFATALEHYSTSLMIFSELGNERARAILLHNVGLLTTEEGHLAEGRRLLAEGLELHRRLGHHAIVAEVLAYCGINALYRGDLEAARAAFTESLLVARSLNEVSLTYGLEGFALLAAAEGSAELAIRLASALAALRRRIGTVETAIVQRRHDRWLTPARSALGASEVARAWSEGAQTTAAEAVEHALLSRAAVPARASRWQASQRPTLAGEDWPVAAHRWPLPPA